MAKYKLEIITNEKGKTKTKRIKYSTTNPETVQVYKSVNKETKILLGEVTYGHDISPTPLPPSEDKAPIVDAGEDVVVVENAEVRIDGSAHDDGSLVRVEWFYDDAIKDLVKIDPEDPTNVIFKAPGLSTEDAIGFFFKLEVEDDKSNISRDTWLITVTKTGELPAPPPPPPATTLLYDSNIHGKWNDGRKRIVKSSEGNVGPDGKGLYMAASGNPELHIDGDGVAHLVSGSGAFGDVTDKTGGNRHQRGGSTKNRFGGVGNHIAKGEVGFKIEKYHKKHEDGVEKSLAKSLQEDVWYKSRFTVTHNNGKIQQKLEIDYNDGNGYVKVLKSEFSNPQDYYMDKELMLQHSEFWIRLNNKDHGRIYFCVCNFDSVMEKEFMIESGTSVALKNVRMTAL